MLQLARHKERPEPRLHPRVIRPVSHGAPNGHRAERHAEQQPDMNRYQAEGHAYTTIQVERLNGSAAAAPEDNTTTEAPAKTAAAAVPCSRELDRRIRMLAQVRNQP